MFKFGHKDFACLLNILESIEKIKSYTDVFQNADDFHDDTKSFDAVMMNFVVIGEMADKLTHEFVDTTSCSIDWHKTIGFRNIIAHNYFGIDAEEVWQIIQNDISRLNLEIKKIIGR